MPRITSAPFSAGPSDRIVAPRRARKSLPFFALAAAMLCLVPTSAPAAVLYTYATDVPSLTLAPGQLGAVNLYLVETTSDGSASRLTTEDGLFGAYVDVTYQPGSPAVASPPSIFSVSTNTAEFNDPSGADTSVFPSFAYIRELTDIFAPTGPEGTPDPSDPTVRRVFLGSVAVTGGSSPGTTTFRVGDDPAHTDTLTFDAPNSPLDPLISPTSFTVTALVPEPSLFTACGLALLPALRRRR